MIMAGMSITAERGIVSTGSALAAVRITSPNRPGRSAPSGLGSATRTPTLREAVHDWAKECAEDHGLAIQPGDMVFELLLPGANKGEAVRQIMDRRRFAGSCPVYIGDDLTDIPAIIAARRFGGRGIAVGQKIAAHADDTLAGPTEVISHIRKLLA